AAWKVLCETLICCAWGQMPSSHRVKAASAAAAGGVTEIASATRLAAANTSLIDRFIFDLIQSDSERARAARGSDLAAIRLGLSVNAGNTSKIGSPTAVGLFGADGLLRILVPDHDLEGARRRVALVLVAMDRTARDVDE